MKRLIAASAALALLAAPAAAGAKPTQTDRTNAAKECKAERGTTAATKEAFRLKYGTNKTKSNAFGKCVSSHARSEERQRKAAVANAAKACKAERALDPAAFAAKYGTNKNKKNAFGKCVSQTAKKLKAAADAKDKAKAVAVKNAAKTCAAERAANAQAFADEYGKNKNDKNAFGKCVSALAKTPAA